MRRDIFCFVSKSNSSDAYRSSFSLRLTNAFFKNTLALARERENVTLLGGRASVNRNQIAADKVGSGGVRWGCKTFFSVFWSHAEQIANCSTLLCNIRFLLSLIKMHLQKLTEIYSYTFILKEKESVWILLPCHPCTPAAADAGFISAHGQGDQR